MSAAVQQKPQLLVKLSVVKGPHAGQTFQLNKPVLTIGRGPENDIVLLNDPQVSRAHAKLVLVDRDFEVVNLSQKNAVFVNGQPIDKWKLINKEKFLIGDSEFLIEYDLGQSVASVPAKKLAEVVALKPRSVATAPKPQTPAPRPMQSPAKPIPRVHMATPPPQSAAPSLLKDPRFRFYAIAALVIGGFLYYLLAPTKPLTAQKVKSILKYEDEIAIKMNSTPEKDLIQKRLDLQKEKNSPQKQRAEENFIKGMRDFQLGNYARSLEFFQVVLNLEPDHVLARRHLYLSKVRFDELVQAKLMLGESYYKKHNFKMCESLYQQVMDMLGEKKTDDPKYKLAASKTKECNLAAEGIR